MSEKDPQEWIETAWEYELAVECELAPDDVHGYFRTVDDRVSHHTWFRMSPGQSRWNMVTEEAVMNAIENSNGSVRLREPDAFIAEIEEA